MAGAVTGDGVSLDKLAKTLAPYLSKNLKILRRAYCSPWGIMEELHNYKNQYDNIVYIEESKMKRFL